MKHIPLYLLMLSLAIGLLTGCIPIDRSGEQPFAPTVVTDGITISGDSAWMTGHVKTSPNSDLTACGFIYGNDTLRREVKVAVPAVIFRAWTDSLGVGNYYAVAFATNGIGTSYGDTLRFTINPH